MSAPDVRELEKEAGGIAVLVSAEIYRTMERLGISQNEMARRIGCTPAHLSNVLNGERLPSLRMIVRIGWACGGFWRIGLERIERERGGA